MSNTHVMSVTKISESQLETIFENLKKEHQLYLSEHGVVIPKKFRDNISSPINKNVLQLCFAYQNQGLIFHKNQVSEFVSFYYKKNTDQQVRHLSAQKGWNILGGGEYYGNYKLKPGEHVLLNTKLPKDGFKSNKRINDIKLSNWEAINSEKKCFTCGIKEGESHKVGTVIKPATIQQGHKDPSKPLDIDNIIPQCDYCNRYYKDYFVFNDDGRIKSIHSIDYILQHDEKFLKQLMIHLSQRLHK